jgi:hypothetical protein
MGAAVNTFALQQSTLLLHLCNTTFVMALAVHLIHLPATQGSCCHQNRHGHSNPMPKQAVIFRKGFVDFLRCSEFISIKSFSSLSGKPLLPNSRWTFKWHSQMLSDFLNRFGALPEVQWIFLVASAALLRKSFSGHTGHPPTPNSRCTSQCDSLNYCDFLNRFGAVEVKPLP